MNLAKLTRWAWHYLPKISFRLLHGYTMFFVFVVGWARGMGFPGLRLIAREVAYALYGVYLDV